VLLKILNILKKMNIKEILRGEKKEADQAEISDLKE
jgi:hypothetical protein